jgi:hypothetical protein
VALSKDGNTAIVGSLADGATVFTRNAGVWTQQGSKLVGSGVVLGAWQDYSVALSGDGNTAIVGGPTDNNQAGAAWVFTRNAGVWTQQGSKLVGSDAVGNANQGVSVALSGDGNTAIIGGQMDNRGAGAAWVFTRNDGVWTQQGSKLVGSGASGLGSQQGYSVALSGDGNTAILGSLLDGNLANINVGAAWVFTRNGGVWTQQGSKLVGSGTVGGARQGLSVALSGDGNTAIAGGPLDDSNAGAAWVFTRNVGVWTQQGSKLVGSGAIGTPVYQGYSVALSGDGNTAMVGSQDNGGVGAAWVFTNDVLKGTGLRFVPVAPCRVADTRLSGGRIGDGQTRLFDIPGSSCGVPTSAQAYSLNVAAVPAGPLGYLAVWPSGQSQPVVSTLNSLDSRVKSNAAIVPAGVGGAINVFASNATDVVLDINGYFVPASDPAGLAFYPVTPCRIVDTRKAVAPLAGPSLPGGQARTFPILSASACNIPPSAQAYSLNFAAVPNGPLGYITAWPAGQNQPVVATLNAPTGAITANAAIVPAETGGAINVFASNATDLVIDINGYFAPPSTGGLSFYNVTPCRVLDSRQPSGTPPFNGKRDVPIAAGTCGLPIAAAYVVSATVVPVNAFGYLTLWAQGQIQPTVATLNAIDGAVTSNLAIVPANAGGISAFASNPTHLVMDLFGYFAQ